MRKKEKGRPLLAAKAQLETLRLRHDALELENEMFKARKEVCLATTPAAATWPSCNRYCFCSVRCSL